MAFGKKLYRQGIALVFLTAIVVLGLQTVGLAQVDRVVIWSPGDSGAVTDWRQDPILQSVEEATNTDIEMRKLGWENYQDQINAAIAGRNVPDIIGTVSHTSRSLIAQWVRDGVIAPFEGEVAAAAPNLMHVYEINPILQELMIDGKIYMVPVSWGDATYPNGGLIHVRKDLLDQYGMEPPTNFEEYFDFLRACRSDGRAGVVFGAQEGIGAAINAFAGAHGLPHMGWVEVNGGYEFALIQPGMRDALVLFRTMVGEGFVDPVSWEIDGGAARDRYAAGTGCSLIFNGGGHIGRIQNDMNLAGHGGQNWLLPALDAGAGNRGYTAEPQFWGATFLGNLSGNNPVAAARVINYLMSDEGYQLTALGIEGRHYEEVDGEIRLLPERTQDGFPTEAGDTGAHPLATTIVSWVPQEWQDWALLYGSDADFQAWYEQMWGNQGMYQTPAYGLLTTSPQWNRFEATSADIVSRSFLEIVRAPSDEAASVRFDQFVSEWLGAGGAEAQAEISEVLEDIYR